MLFGLLFLAPSTARAEFDFAEWYKHVRVSAFLNPSFEWVQHDAPAEVEGSPTLRRQVETLDRLGFAQSRARAYVNGNWRVGQVDLDFRLELEGLPQFSLFDAYVAARVPLAGNGLLRVVLGQHKAPIDRHILVWEPDIQMATRNWMAGSEPGHQLGASAQLWVPHAPWLQVSAGAYNGEGRNQLTNIDRNFLYAARLAVRPVGPLAPLVESAHGPTQLSIAVDWALNRVALGDADQRQLLVGADLFASWQGLSAYGRFLWIDNSFVWPAGTPPEMMNRPGFKTIGYVGQAGYLLPIPGYLYRRFELVVRYQGIVRDDQVGGLALADPNQAQYDLTVGLNFYELGHGFKVQLNYDRFFYPKEPKRGALFDTAADAIYAQVTYRLE